MLLWLLMLLGVVAAGENLRAYQMITYTKNSTYLGSQVTTFNSFIGTLNNPELKIVFLPETQFTQDNLKTLLDKKAYGVCIVVQNMSSLIASKKWMDAYRFSLENNHHMPIYFMDDQNKTYSKLGSIAQNTNAKLIAAASIGSTHAKVKLIDFVGEVRESRSETGASRSRLLISGLDSYFVTASRVVDFSQSGAGLVTHMSLARSLAYLVDQYGELANNVINYFSATSFDEFSSVASYFKKNPHSYFTAGIEQVLVFKRITSDAHFDITVYNVDESNRLDYDYLTKFEEIAKRVGITVSIYFKNVPYIVGVTAPTLVFNDDAKSDKFLYSGYLAKLKVLTEFLVGDTVGISSKKLSEVVFEKTDPEFFIQSYSALLRETPRPPFELTTTSSFPMDFEQRFKSFSRKWSTFEYVLPGMKFSETKLAELKLVDAKGSLFDLVGFVFSLGLVLALQVGFKFVGFSSSEAKTKSKET